MTLDSSNASNRKCSLGNQSKKSKIQSLIIKHLLDHGSLDIMLPDGIVLEIGVSKIGKPCRDDDFDYSYVAATQGDRSVVLDRFSLGMSFEDKDDSIVLEDKFADAQGRELRRLDVI